MDPSFGTGAITSLSVHHFHYRFKFVIDRLDTVKQEVIDCALFALFLSTCVCFTKRLLNR